MTQHEGKLPVHDWHVVLMLLFMHTLYSVYRVFLKYYEKFDFFVRQVLRLDLGSLDLAT